MTNGKGQRVTVSVGTWVAFWTPVIGVLVAMVIAYQTARSDIDNVAGNASDNTRDISRLINSMERYVDKARLSLYPCSVIHRACQMEDLLHLQVKSYLFLWWQVEFYSVSGL